MEADFTGQEIPANGAVPPQLMYDFLGSAQVFVTALSEIVEEKILSAVAGETLTLSQFKLLKLVANTDAHSIGAVAAFLGVSNAAASKAVDKLVRRKMLLRTEGQEDRRESQLSLPPRAQRSRPPISAMCWRPEKSPIAVLPASLRMMSGWSRPIWADRPDGPRRL